MEPAPPPAPCGRRARALVTCPGALSCPRARPHTPECPSQDKPAAAQAKLNDKASSPPSALPPPCHWASPRCSCLIKAQPWGWPSPVPTGAVLSGRRGLGPRTGPYSRGGPPESRRPDSCLGGGGARVPAQVLEEAETGNLRGTGHAGVPATLRPPASPGPDRGPCVPLRELADPVTWAPPFPAGACLTLVLVAPLSTGSPTRWLFPNVSSFQPDPTAGAYGTETDSSLAAPEALTFHFCMVRGQLSAQNPPEAQRQGKAFSQSCLPDAPNGEHPLFRNHSHLQVDAAPVPGSLLAPAPRPLHSRPPPEEVCALATPPSAPRGSGQ